MDHVLPGLTPLSQPTLNSNRAIPSVQGWFLRELVSVLKRAVILRTKPRELILRWNDGPYPTQRVGERTVRNTPCTERCTHLIEHYQTTKVSFITYLSVRFWHFSFNKFYSELCIKENNTNSKLCPCRVNNRRMAIWQQHTHTHTHLGHQEDDLNRHHRRPHLHRHGHLCWFFYTACQSPVYQRAILNLIQNNKKYEKKRGKRKKIDIQFSKQLSAQHSSASLSSG